MRKRAFPLLLTVLVQTVLLAAEPSNAEWAVLRRAARKRGVPEMWFGDGSQFVTGSAEVKSVKFGRLDDGIK